MKHPLSSNIPLEVWLDFMNGLKIRDPEAISQVSVIIATTSKAIAETYQHHRQNPGKVSGIATGEAASDALLCELLACCHDFDITPPKELVDAIKIRLVPDGDDRRYYIPQSLPEPLDKLTSYFLLNPSASKLQAHRDTGLARATVYKYLANPDWNKILKIKKMLFTRDEIENNNYDRFEIIKVLTMLDFAGGHEAFERMYSDVDRSGW